MKKRWLAMVTVLCLMVTMVAPVVYAEETTDETTETTTVTRIEAESYDHTSQGTNTYYEKVKDVETASGGQIIDNVQENHTFRLAKDIDLTGLQSVTMAVGHISSGVEYGIYIDGSVNNPGLKIATIVGTSSNGWDIYKPHTVDVIVAPEFLVGEHDLYLRVDKPLADSVYCGNVDYLELTFDPSTITETKIEAEWASGTGRSIDEAAYAEYSYRSSESYRPAKTYYYAEGATSSGADTTWGAAAPEGEWASTVTALDNTYTGDAYYLGEYDLTGLTELTMRLANNQQSGVSYSFYIDGTATTLGTKIATITNIKTGSWSNFQEITVPMIASAKTVSGKHTLFFAIDQMESSTNGGNFDWFTFKTEAVTGNSLVTSTTTNFSTYNSKEGNGGKDTGNGYIGLGSTNSETLVLGFDNVRFDDLSTMAMSYAPQGASTVNVYKGAPNETDGTLITSFTLNSDDIYSGDQWYESTNLRTTYYDLGDHGLTGVDTLYFSMVRASGAVYVGNFEEFTLYYEEIVSLPSAMIEGEDYVWGFSNSASTDVWQGSTYLNGTRNGDIFYFGKVDLDALKQITLRIATANSDITAYFYAGMVIPEDMTRYGTRDKYKSDTGLTGGTLIGSTAIHKTNASIIGDNAWKAFTYFNCDVNTDLTGEHDIYMALVSSDTSYTGNVDYVEFVGVESVSTATNLMGDITIVGDGSVTIPQNLDYGATATISSTAGAGYEFTAWVVNGTVMPATDSTMPVSVSNEITAYFTKYGETPVVDGIVKLEAEDYEWGVSDKTEGWDSTASDSNGNTVGIINNTKGNDTFYLGKVDLTALQQIVVRAAKGNAGSVTYEFYADMTVGSDSWETVSDRKYKPTSSVTGGTLLTTVTVSQTDDNKWATYKNFAADATALTGEHDVYMKMTGGENDWHGRIDSVSFVYEQTSEVTVSFIGKYNEAIATETVTSADKLAALLESTKAPTIHGFIFKGWDNVLTAEGLFETYKNSAVNITAVYEADLTTTYAPTLGADLTAVDGANNEVTGTSALTFDARVTVTATESDKKVAYWVLDGAKVGFGESSYVFYISGKNTIDVVYADEVAEGETLTSSVVLQQSVAPYNGSTYTFSVVAQTSIVADDTVSEYGVIYAGSLEALTAIRGGKTANTIKVKSSKTAANAQYITHLLQVKPGKARYAMAYMIIGETTYYSAQYATVTLPTDGSAVTPTVTSFQ